MPFSLSDPAPDNGTEIITGNLLRAGVLLSAVTVAVGGVFYMCQFGALPPQHQVFEREPEQLRTVVGIITLASHLDPRGIIALGILLLVATPIARVLFSVWAFAREHDHLYVGITLIVLTLLLYSLFQV